MPTVDTSQLSELLESFHESAEIVLKTQNPVACERLENHLHEIEGYVRELQQAMWADAAEETLARLERNDPLTPADKEVIRTFLVSDADRYLANENNYGDWVQELRRLSDAMVRRSRSVDRDSIGDLRGSLADTLRLLPDIRNYLEERRRVERCDVAVGELEPQTRDMLVRIIKEQLFSSAC